MHAEISYSVTHVDGEEGTAEKTFLMDLRLSSEQCADSANNTFAVINSRLDVAQKKVIESYCDGCLMQATKCSL